VTDAAPPPHPETDMTTTTLDSYANSTATAARAATSPWKRRLGWTLSGLAILFLAFDAGAKLAMVDEVVKGSAELGYPVETILPMGIILLVSTLVYAIPRTAVIGAVLLTGYLGGAIATHLRVLHPLFSHTLFPIYFAVILWGGLYLRDSRVRALIRPQA
jgi:hypothetical protein